MLHITLNKDDYVMIGSDIRVQYGKNNGKGTCAIGITAPRELKILRGSVQDTEKAAVVHKKSLRAQGV